MRYSIYIGAASLLLLSLSGCKGTPTDPLNPDNTVQLCRDGVEYLMFEKSSWSTSGHTSYSISVVPHFKPDGTLYTCKTQSPLTK